MTFRNAPAHDVRRGVSDPFRKCISTTDDGCAWHLRRLGSIGSSFTYCRCTTSNRVKLKTMKPRHFLPFANCAVLPFNLRDTVGISNISCAPWHAEDRARQCHRSAQRSGHPAAYRMRTVLVVLILGLLPHTMVAE